ncbi:MAG: response regulator [candidate division Zixibacteria bacterium]|nr:response regulator [candidate division Zixibacteria bacterium]MBU1470010.1 response regulator [candidate division Zixibacteria bacterium]MBU2626270.1 response regulator [candidate division Zixibacteria bacterium]
MRQQHFEHESMLAVGDLEDQQILRAVALDDEPEVIETIIELMKDFGFYIVGETDPSKAYSLIRDFRPDVIILDILMPDIDGYEFAGWLASDENISKIPIVYVTSKDFRNDLCQSFARGGTMYVKKPFLAEELADSLRIAISLARAI